MARPKKRLDHIRELKKTGCIRFTDSHGIPLEVAYPLGKAPITRREIVDLHLWIRTTTN